MGKPVDLKEAADRAGVSVDTMRRHAKKGSVKARQLDKRSPWRVWLDEDGFPLTMVRSRLAVAR